MAHSVPVYTVAVGGAAGDGIKEGGLHLGELVQRLGCFAYMTMEYPSLIRGGHNFVRMSYSEAEVFMDRAPLDALVATNAGSVLLHKDELKEGAVVLIDEPHAASLPGITQKVIPLPMSSAQKEANAPHAAGPSVGVGAYCYLAGLTRKEAEDMLPLVFGDILGGVEMNVGLALRGFDAAAVSGVAPKKELRVSGTCVHTGVLLEGNKAVAMGFQAAGLEYYIGYPMTPSSSILHFLAKEAAKGKLTVIHPEDEIAVANMALGVSYAGKRVAVGSATGGFALMQEALSFAGISEIPLAVAVSQRQGPATGAATRTSQADLRFVVSSGHGEFPRIVIAPGDPEEAYIAAGTVLNLAWKYQTPAIILLDKQISESFRTSIIDMRSVVEGGTKLAENAEDYKRFRITHDGISPLLFPGTPGAAVKATSYEHDEFGIANDTPETVRAMQEKRWRKMDGIRGEMLSQQTVKIYGHPNAEDAIVFWGSTKGAVLEAAKDILRPLRLVQVLWMEPFPSEELSRALSGAKRIVNVEANHNGQLAGLIREKTGITMTESILKYDARPFEPTALAKDITALFS